MTAPPLTVTVTHTPPNFDPQLTSWKERNENKRIKFQSGHSLSHLLPKVFSLLHQLYLHANLPGLLARCPKQTAVLVPLLSPRLPPPPPPLAPLLKPLSGSKCAAQGCEALALGGNAASSCRRQLKERQERKDGGADVTLGSGVSLRHRVNPPQSISILIN